MLPGGDYKETAEKAGELVKKGFNPVPHFPARSISDENQLKDYISRCKDVGVKQALVLEEVESQLENLIVQFKF
jgi:methylenetetrahydrofolate reductase (NADPH)